MILGPGEKTAMLEGIQKCGSRGTRQSNNYQLKPGSGQSPHVIATATSYAPATRRERSATANRDDRRGSRKPAPGLQYNIPWSLEPGEGQHRARVFPRHAQIATIDRITLLPLLLRGRHRTDLCIATTKASKGILNWLGSLTFVVKNKFSSCGTTVIADRHSKLESTPRTRSRRPTHSDKFTGHTHTTNLVGLADDNDNDTGYATFDHHPRGGPLVEELRAGRKQASYSKQRASHRPMAAATTAAVYSNRGQRHMQHKFRSFGAQEQNRFSMTIYQKKDNKSFGPIELPLNGEIWRNVKSKAATEFFESTVSRYPETKSKLQAVTFYIMVSTSLCSNKCGRAVGLQIADGRKLEKKICLIANAKKIKRIVGRSFALQSSKSGTATRIGYLPSRKAVTQKCLSSTLPHPIGHSLYRREFRVTKMGIIALSSAHFVTWQ
ncbi:hypothetical protein EI94DRAFT_1700494 [Lactarius quietus]|nr:hypothetical protein EI94DRAFT_1700494 [Lactarius quietus]